ncbi:hypothetical protein ABT369_46915 [Dactylosporangium sp. NPDC000244]|uniref:hypothetical protein n=1 Tax=Dactylosporangium sp. NPDC000244 TaxID=3154365 RepID=UPI003325E521
MVLLCTGAPFKMRWAASRSAFAAMVAGHPIPPSGSEWEDLAVPHRLGLYTITRAGWVPGGAIFFEAQGDVFYDAGFAYLPGGPTRDVETAMFESANFHHLGGWYRWAGTSKRNACRPAPAICCVGTTGPESRAASHGALDRGRTAW